MWIFIGNLYVPNGDAFGNTQFAEKKFKMVVHRAYMKLAYSSFSVRKQDSTFLGPFCIAKVNKMLFCYVCSSE